MKTLKTQPATKVQAEYSNTEYLAMFNNFKYQAALIGGNVSFFANTRMASYHSIILFRVQCLTQAFILTLVDWMPLCYILLDA